MAGERDRIRHRGGAGADHQAVERQACRLVGVHHAFALVERERGRLAGGAEHVEAVAAIVEQIARQLGRARLRSGAPLSSIGVATAAITPDRVLLNVVSVSLSELI